MATWWIVGLDIDHEQVIDAWLLNQNLTCRYRCSCRWPWSFWRIWTGFKFAKSVAAHRCMLLELKLGLYNLDTVAVGHDFSGWSGENENLGNLCLVCCSRSLATVLVMLESFVLIYIHLLLFLRMKEPLSGWSSLWEFTLPFQRRAQKLHCEVCLVAGNTDGIQMQ